MINGYTKNKFFKQSFKLFNQICKSKVTLNEFTLSSIVKILGELGEIVSGKIVHGSCVRNEVFGILILLILLCL